MENSASVAICHYAVSVLGWQLGAVRVRGKRRRPRSMLWVQRVAAFIALPPWTPGIPHAVIAEQMSCVYDRVSD